MKPTFEQAMPVDCGYIHKDALKDQKWQMVHSLYENNYIKQKEGKTLSIPKKIHLIWLGGDLPSIYQKFYESWKKHHPDFEVKLWLDGDLENFDFVNRKIFELAPNYGAKSDILRYEILFQFGGLYVDTDFICLNSFEPLHTGLEFYTGIGLSPSPIVYNGLIGCSPHHPIIKRCIENLEVTKEVDFNKIMDHSGPQYFSKQFFDLINYGDRGTVAFPANFFYPFPGRLRYEANQELVGSYLKPYSLCVHLWQTSWQKRALGLEMCDWI